DRRPGPLRLGRVRARVRRLPRRRVGPPAARGGRDVRAAEPGGLPVRPVLDRGPAQAPGVPGGVRRVRPGGGRGVRRGRRRAPAGRRRHRPQPPQDRGDRGQRARRAGAGRAAGRAAVVLRARAPRAAGRARRRAGDEPGVRGDGEGAQAAGPAVRRSDDVLRVDAGHRHRGRSCPVLLASSHPV
ncbi:MAG: DNA-3-methyladenine glycosylase, partial [uncultured Pseudonocardia sp.]